MPERKSRTSLATRRRVALFLMVVLPIVTWLPVVYLATYGSWWLRVVVLMVSPLAVSLVADGDEVKLGGGTGLVTAGVTLIVVLSDGLLNGGDLRDPQLVLKSLLLICLAVAGLGYVAGMIVAAARIAAQGRQGPADASEGPGSESSL